MEANENKEVLSVKEVAEYLQVSESKIRQMVKRKGIPHVKIDGQYRFYLPTIRAWLEGRTIQAIEGLVSTEEAKTTADDIWDQTKEK